MKETVALVMCRQRPEESASDRRYAGAPAERGFAIRDAPWNGPPAALAGAGLLVLRSNWDYHHAAAAFRDWLKRLDAAGVRVPDQPDLVLWNMDKSYLLDLARWGVAIPARRVVAPDAEAVRARRPNSVWNGPFARPHLAPALIWCGWRRWPRWMTPWRRSARTPDAAGRGGGVPA